jgi:hypothetical protein
MLLPALHIRYHTAAILAVHLGTVGIRSPIQRSYTFSTIIPSFQYSIIPCAWHINIMPLKAI